VNLSTPYSIKEIIKAPSLVKALTTMSKSCAETCDIRLDRRRDSGC
jgi:hypothetical protein